MRLMLPRGQIQYRRLKIRKALVEKGRERIGGDSSPDPPPPTVNKPKWILGPTMPASFTAAEACTVQGGS